MKQLKECRVQYIRVKKGRKNAYRANACAQNEQALYCLPCHIKTTFVDHVCTDELESFVKLLAFSFLVLTATPLLFVLKGWLCLTTVCTLALLNLILFA